MDSFMSAQTAISIGNFWLAVICSGGIMLLVDSLHRWGSDPFRLARGGVYAVAVMLAASPVSDRIAGVDAAVARGCAAIAQEYGPEPEAMLSAGDRAAVETVCGSFGRVAMAGGQ